MNKSTIMLTFNNGNDKSITKSVSSSMCAVKSTPIVRIDSIIKSVVKNIPTIIKAAVITANIPVQIVEKTKPLFLYFNVENKDII